MSARRVVISCLDDERSTRGPIRRDKGRDVMGRPVAWGWTPELLPVEGEPGRYVAVYGDGSFVFVDCEETLAALTE
jgi:hypothetical protein